MTREEFEREFHSRTLAYQPAFRTDHRPVLLHVGDDAHTPAGHALLVGVINQLARAHQHIAIVGATTGPLLCPAPFGLTAVEDASVGLAQAINPFIAVTGETATDALTSIAIGRTDERVDLRVGCNGWCATFGPDAAIGTDRRSVPGAMLASCIAAGFAFHQLVGPAQMPKPIYSLWDFGVHSRRQGPTLDGPLEIGRVLQVGAGGVGASLDFWLALTGLAGAWTICDGDVVDVTNLNRQLAFLASHAGFRNQPEVNKATAAAALLGPAAVPDPRWFGETAEVVNSEYDVVLALANEHGVRSALQARQGPVLLHATTSTNWEAQFHRHIAGRDDCISCRIPEAAPVLSCSEARVVTRTHTDAALPFLSGAAGLLLLAGLFRLQHGELLVTDRNFISLNFAEPGPIAQQLRRSCSDGCSHWAPARIRRRLGIRTRYAALDPARAGV